MSNLNHTIRRFNRFELKYLLTLRQAERFKTDLKAYLQPDEHGDGSYSLSSLYYDSPDLRCYWEKVDGVKFRRKLRIRHYETSEPMTDKTPVFVEIKQRVDSVTQKRRLCNQREMPDQVAPDEHATLDEVYAFLWQYNLRPASIVRYLRQAFIGTEYDLGLRVTFDTQLSVQAHSLKLDEPPNDLPMLPPDNVVMEIKVNERIPYWLTELVAAHNLQMVRVSKYCKGIEAARLVSA